MPSGTETGRDTRIGDGGGHIRPFASRDVEVVLELWLKLMENGAAADQRYAVANDAVSVIRPYVRDQWTRTSPFAHALVYVEDSVIVGFITCSPRRALPLLTAPPAALLGDLYVSSSHRRRGIGRALVDAMVTRVQQVGFGSLEVGTLLEDHQAVAFWQGIGFRGLRITLQRDLP